MADVPMNWNTIRSI